jgi:hypothetical protein
LASRNDRDRPLQVLASGLLVSGLLGLSLPATASGREDQAGVRKELNGRLEEDAAPGSADVDGKAEAGPGPARPRPKRTPFLVKERHTSPFRRSIPFADAAPEAISAPSLPPEDGPDTPSLEPGSGSLPVGPWAGRRPPMEAIVPGANLAGADLSHMDLRGRSLAGARLFMAKVHGTLGLDLDGAELHPFFDPGPRRRGSLDLLELSDPHFRPRQILVGSRGDLFLLEPGKPGYQVVTPTGYTAPRWQNSKPIKLMTQAPGNRVCFIQHGLIATEDDANLYTDPSGHQLRLDTEFNGATSALFSDQGYLWTTLPGLVIGYSLSGGNLGAHQAHPGRAV